MQCEARLFIFTYYPDIIVTPRIVFFGLTGEEGFKHALRYRTPDVRLWPVVV